MRVPRSSCPGLGDRDRSRCVAGFLPTAPPFPRKESFASGPHLSVDRWSGRVLIQEMQPLCLDRDCHPGLDSSCWINKGRLLSLEEPSGSNNLPEASTVASMIAAVRPDPSLVVEGPAAVVMASQSNPLGAGTAPSGGEGTSHRSALQGPFVPTPPGAGTAVPDRV